MLARWNRWYDAQQEPKRFLLFMTPATLVILVAMLAPVPYNLVALLVMLVVLAARVHYHHGL